jgi:hypothetical protein
MRSRAPSTASTNPYQRVSDRGARVLVHCVKDCRSPGCTVCDAGNTKAPTMIIAERGADFILGSAPPIAVCCAHISARPLIPLINKVSFHQTISGGSRA